MSSPYARLVDQLATRIEPIGISRALDDRTLLAKVAFAVVGGAVVNVGLLVVIQFAFDEPLAGAISMAQLTAMGAAAVYAYRTGKIVSPAASRPQPDLAKCLRR